MRMIVAITVVCLQCGCSWDLSDAEPYKALIGHEVTLQQPVRLHEGEGSNVRLLFVLPPSWTVRPSDLPEGTPLCITAVKGHKDIMTWVVKAYGTAVVPDTTNTVEWEYLWGLAGRLERAPWEDPHEVPEFRGLRKNGRITTEWVLPR